MNKMKIKTYSKNAVKALLIIGCINATMPYILAAFGRDPVTELGITWIKEIVAVILGYLCKSYFETKQKRKQDLADFEAGMISEEEFNDGNDVG